jgi:hypothetical protein
MKNGSVLRNPLLGKVNALAVLAAWTCLALLIGTLAYLMLTAAPDSAIFPLMLMFAAFLLLVATHIALSFFVSCPHCNERLTAQSFTKPPYGDWSGAVSGGSVVQSFVSTAAVMFALIVESMTYNKPMHATCETHARDGQR